MTIQIEAPRARAIAALGSVLLLAFAAPLAAQISSESTGPVHLGYDPNTPRDGHVHVGEMGEKLLFVEHALKCNCGTCSFDAHTCQFQMTCGTSPVWTQRIIQSLEAGESEDAILAGFVADYGPSVLIAPPPEGFNLVGYLLPGVTILSIGMLLGLLIRGGPGRVAPAGVRELDDADAARLQDALRQLDEGESPDW